MRESVIAEQRPDAAVTAQATLVEVLRARARLSGDRIVYCWLDEHEAEHRVTYAQLDARASAIAARIREDCRDGDRVLLCYEPGLHYVSAFLGCLYAGVIAVPAYAPVSARTARRVERIMADATPAAVLSTATGLQIAQRWLTATGDRPVTWIATDALTEQPASMEARATPAIDALAYLQYTSGSTTLPKGVMITHRNLVENLAQIAGFGQFDAASVLATWPPCSSRLRRSCSGRCAGSPPFHGIASPTAADRTSRTSSVPNGFARTNAR